MTEADWLESIDLTAMLEHVKRQRPRVRRIRLFAAGCCRRVWQQVTDERIQTAIEAVEKFAESPGKQPDKAELKTAWIGACGAAEDASPNRVQFRLSSAVVSASEPTDAFWAAQNAVSQLIEAVGKNKRPEEATFFAGLLRDVVGNPFRPVSIDADWRIPVVTQLAQAAYEERILPSGELDTSRLAVLADALEESGCANAEILTHLKGPGPHLRGCFVVDLLLGRV